MKTRSNGKYTTDDLIRAQLHTTLEQGATRQQLCEQLGISEPFLSQFLNRSRQHASAIMLRRLGYDDETRYYKRTP